MARKRFRIELLPTAEGLNLASAAQKKKDTVVVFLWCDYRKIVEKIAEKMAESLSYGTSVGTVEYIVRSIRLVRKSSRV